MGIAGVEPTSDDELVAREVEKLVHSAEQTQPLEVPEISDLEIKEATDLTNALANLRDAERELSEASRVALGLSEQDMRAVQFLVVSLRRGDIVTPSMLANYLKISPASTTKLLNKLERNQHITRLIHPTDRRAFKIEVSPETEALTQRSVGRQQARRLLAALQLTSQERAVATQFLNELTQGIRDDREHWHGASQQQNGRSTRSQLET